MEKKKQKTMYGKNWCKLFLFITVLSISQCVASGRPSKVDYITKQYQKKLNLFNDWSILNGGSNLDKDTILYSNIEEFETLYKFELQSIFNEELSIIKYHSLRYSKTYDQIDQKLDIFFEVQGRLYFDYGFEFSPGGGYFYLPKSKPITDKKYKDLKQKLALLDDFEKFWRTRK